jgi:hypothetical protein
MSHVFISYSRQNRTYARRLADHLIASGFDVWIDDRIDYGSLWADVIQKAIEDCAAFVIIMSPESRESQWVQTECEYAAQQGKKVFPLLLDGDVFFRYVSVQYVNVTGGALPPDAFLDEVAEHAPRKPGRGEDVTSPEANAGKQASPVTGAETVRRVRLRRRAPLVAGVGITAVLLLIALAILVRDGQSSTPQTQPSATEPAQASPQTEVMAAAQTGTRQPGGCQTDWFFGDKYAVAGDCPVSAVTEVSGLAQEFGDGVLIGVLISDTGDGRYFVLENNGLYLDLTGDWETAPVNVGTCVLPSVAGFALPYQDTANQAIGCPAQPVQVGSLSYQASDSDAESVVYIGTPGNAVYRLAAPSSRPGTEGEWQRIR